MFLWFEWLSRALRCRALNRFRYGANVIGILIGIGAIVLGAKGFTATGLPFTSTKRLEGPGAKAIGITCVLIGLAFIADGIYAMDPRN